MTPEQVLTLAGVVVSLVAVLATFLGTRGKTKTDAKTALDARIDARVKAELDRVYARLDEFEERDKKRTSAFTRILRAIAAQWTGDSRGPNLDPADIAEIEDTIPPQWIR
ncbi:hypothetical protein SCB71_06240 [Herbiconiux sp. KACC 21604]|uniref:hypothetical protein n=1 Tax=unclassified Herbiconiux TaxID=2618217 RepID=UPI0014914D2D|nr:hypothetical protein [Herbiconiux sp. SALV-R1]QJU52917.1 hypothetical protein HL652_04225 [Herbiconiux sp. SALV-R1]WPO87837.1 hypothetical protein SCB71_06240 [Herbiconiux sp. KACC 21604]